MDEEIENIARECIGAAIEVHRELGPGLLESAYEHCLHYELARRGIESRRQVAQPISHKELSLDEGYRIDLLVSETLLVELKAVDQITPIHQAQLMTYLKLHNSRLGLLINFNSRLLKDGIRRVIL
ncbi:MAG: GxxExxY protein [Symploca sp. SIO2E6]|nr:GxxExxY protein [Symploca sp. SIO2E6]